ncbi:MAG TPA: tripartite tricarboxylate transporter substrate binding protein [Burkholderiales bacterium]|nr:tripartite tricarboxylate transporter substrate binding protein [Burkholderiales bacterium]
MIRLLSSLLLALALSSASLFAADTYPSKPVRLVVPFAAGSATDSAGRILAQALSERLGQNVYVDNRAGANGQIAAMNVKASPADGYTLFMATNSSHSANPHLYKSLPYDPIKDFIPVARVGFINFMLVVHPGVPAANTREFIAYALANPGTLSYATASTASLVGAETINAMAHTDMVGVAYKASPQAMLDLVAGRLQLMVADFATAMPYVRSGKLKVLGVTTAKRSSLLPDVPPLGDTLKGFDMTSWNGLFVPAGTPPAIVARLERETLAALGRAEVREKMAAIGYDVEPMPAAPFAAYVQAQLDTWGKLIRAARIQPE